jgi:hypothetical protein
MPLGDNCLLDEEWESLDEDAKKGMIHEEFLSYNTEYYCKTLCRDRSCHAKGKPNYKS